MATTVKMENYIPSNRPPMKDSEQKWMKEELKKLEKTINSLMAAIKELQDLHP